LLWIARAALSAELPHGWALGTRNLARVYVHADTASESEEHPQMSELRAEVVRERQRAAGAPDRKGLAGYDPPSKHHQRRQHHQRQEYEQHHASYIHGGDATMRSTGPTGMGMDQTRVEERMGLGMGQQGMEMDQIGTAARRHPSGGGYEYAQATAAAAFNAAAAGEPADTREAARRERKLRKEREQRAREKEPPASHQSRSGALSPYRGNMNAGNRGGTDAAAAAAASADKENRGVRRRERDDKLRAVEEQTATAAEAAHRITVKGLQRRVASLEGELAAKDESFEEERMRLELEVNRAIIDKVETERARLAEERVAMQADLRSAIDLERQMAAEEATKKVREAEADNNRRRELDASRLAAREEMLAEELASERGRTSELIGIISQQSRDLAKGGSDVALHLVALERAAALKEAEVRRVLEREKEVMAAEKVALLCAAEERGRASSAAAAARAAEDAAVSLQRVKLGHAADLAAAAGVAEAAAATGECAASDALRRQLEDGRSLLSRETAARVELERLLEAAERRQETSASEASSVAVSAASDAAASDAEIAARSERHKARSERERWASTFVSMRTAIEELRGTQDTLRAEAATAAAAAGQGMAAALDVVGMLGRSARHAVERFAAVQQERRQLSNKLLELKGNIRVFLRIRPLSGGECAKGDFAALTAVSALEAQISLNETSSGLAGAGAGSGSGSGYGSSVGGRRFEMDHVIGPEVAQSEVFEEVEPLIRSALDGYNVCIFAYGQTGSGKTHTMEGTAADRGITFRALAALFREAASEWATHSFSFEVTMLEVYNDRVCDLLEPDPAKPRTHDVRQGGEGGAFVTNLERGGANRSKV